MPASNPPPALIPSAFFGDREAFQYFSELHTFLNLLWVEASGGDSASLALNDTIAGASVGAADTIYSAAGVTTTIKAMTAQNSHTSPVTVYAYILASGVSAASVAPVATQSITNGETATITDIIDHVVPSGGAIAVYASTGGVISITASGLERS